MKDLISGLILTVRSPRTGLRLAVVRQFLKFGAVGIVNTITSVAVYSFVSRPLHQDPLIANAAAFVVAVTVSYRLNKSWTFAENTPASLRQYSQFVSVSAVGLVLSETIVFFMHRVLRLHDFIAFFTAVGVVMFWNFSANRHWIFPPKS